MSDPEYMAMRDEIDQLQEELAALAARQQRDAALAEITASKLDQFSAMLDVIPVGVVLADKTGQIILGNAAVEKMLLHPVLHSSDVASYGEWVSFHKDGRQVESSEYPLARVISDGEQRAELDVHYQRGDGSRFWLRIIGEALLDRDGKNIGAVVALIDIDRERRLDDHQKILIAELNHRVKNAFSVFKSIVSQSLRKKVIPQGVRTTIDERLDAYAEAHSNLVGSDWDETDLASIVQDVVVKMAGGRVTVQGPHLKFPARQAMAISMALYELCANAIKYGALSTPDGTIKLAWVVDKTKDCEELFIDWVERNGPPTVEPTQTGFGSFILDRALSMETGGNVTMSYAAAGFTWQLRMPLS